MSIYRESLFPVVLGLLCLGMLCRMTLKVMTKVYEKDIVIQESL